MKKNSKIQKNNFKSIILTLIVMAAIIIPTHVALALSSQVVNSGGSNTTEWSRDGVQVSKTVEATGIEDYFDITLQVKSKDSVKTIMESDSATVVFVLDLSETMNAAVNGGTISKTNPKKITSTVNQVQNFVNLYKTASANFPNNKVGIVGFNSNGKDLVGLQTVKNLNLDTFNTNLTNAVNNVVNETNYDEKSYRFTNMHAGLKKAQVMLNNCGTKYKYVVFLSDGMPTTYLANGSTNYVGIATNTLTDGINNKRVLVGGNYSDTGAIRAREVAMQLKNSGVKIYSVGVGLKTFSPFKNADYPKVEYTSYSKLNGEQFLVNQLSRSVLDTRLASTVENTFPNITSGTIGEDVWKNNKGKILGIDDVNFGTNKKPIYKKIKWEISKDYSKYTNYYWDDTMSTPNNLSLSTDYNVSNTRNMFGDWLKYGIGSGKYFSIDNTAGFTNLANDIMNLLNEDLENRRTDVWTTTDPMTNYNTTTSDYIDFQGFLNASGNVTTSTKLTGSHEENGNNTAEFKKNQSTDPAGTITWNLQKSGYKSNGTVYVYTLKYRVRLKVEKQGFSDTISYDTNGTTTLTYVNLVNGVASGVKKLYYPIPKVKGYLEDLKITKTVEGIASGKTLPSANSTFTYRVTFKDSTGHDVGNEFTYDKYSGTNTTPIASSTIKSNGTFTLGNNESIVIHNLYHDITWTVTEDAHDGYRQTISSVSPNTVTKSGVTATGTTKSATPLYEVNYKNKLYQLKLKKFDGDATNKNLEGVKFTLYSSLDGDGNPINPVTNMNGELLENLTTDSNGIIDLGNLSFTAGGSTTYYLKEVDTIDRYNLLDTYITVVVNENGITSSYTGHDFDKSNSKVQTISPSENMFEIDVPNIIGIILPQTGGSGEGGMISKTIGMILIILACIGYILTEKEEMFNKRRGEKNMKKYLKLMFTFLLSIVMIGNVYAKMTGDSFTITIKDTEEGHIYEAYQILTGDVSIEEADTTTHQKYFSNIEWGDGVTEEFKTATGSPKAYAETIKDYANDSTDAINVTKTLAKKLSNIKYTSGSFDSTNNKYTISVPKTGYYLVREAKTNVDGKKEYMGTGYIVNLADNIEVRPKRSIPVPTKVINEGEGVHASSKYAVGENVPFKLTGTMPENYDFFETYKYVFHDNLSAGLQFNQASVKVFVKNGTTTTELGASSYEIVNPSTGSYTFDIKFDDTKTGIVDKNGAAVTITKNSTIIVEYNATVLTGAVRGTDGNSNKMLIEYSNNPGTNETGTTTEIETKVYIFDLELTKIGSDTNNLLANARFKLERQKADGAWEVVRGITYQADTPNGIHTFKGLSEGTYRVTEIETPDGYNTIAPFTFTVTPNYNNTKTTLESVTLSTTRSDEVTDLAFDSSDTKYTTMKTTITNTKGITLPLTGGMGSTIFTIAGLALMAIAIITLIKNRKENN